MKKAIKIIRYCLLALVISLPIIKLIVDVELGITLINTEQIIGTYIAIYSILALLSVAMIPSAIYFITTMLFLIIYAFTLYVSNGLVGNSSTLEEYPSPNNLNTIIVDTRITWYPSGHIKLSKKISPFLQKTIKTPKLSGYDKNDNLTCRVLWEDDNTAIITGTVVASNASYFQRILEIFPDEYDFEVIDKTLYFHLD